MSLDKLLKSLDKRYDTSQIPKYEEAVRPIYQTTSTGSLALDVALGTGGWVRGRMHEIAGQPGIGKSSLMMASMAEQQKAYPDQAVVYIDMERTFDWQWALKFGVDLSSSRFIHLKPESSEHVSDMLRAVCASEDVSCAVIDSIGAMESEKAFEKDAGDAIMGKNAQVITRMVKHVAVLADQNNVTVLMVNQLRANIGSMMGGEIAAGPKSLAYMLSISVRLTKGANPPKKVRIAGDDEIVAREIKVRVEKNKVGGGQGRTASYVLNVRDTDKYGSVGIDLIDETMRVGISSGAISQRGAFYTLPDGERIKSKDAVYEYLLEDVSRAEPIRAKAIEIIQGKTSAEGEAEFTTEPAE